MIEKYNLKQLAIIILSLLAGIDFMGLGMYIMSAILVACLVLYSGFFYKCICTRRFLRFFLLCFFSTLLFCLATETLNKNYIASILIMPISMYIAGFCLINSCYDTKRFLIKTILIFSVVITVYGFITSMNKGDLSAYSAYSDAYINNLMRTSYSIWTHNPIAGTVLSPLFVLILAVAVYTLIYLRGIQRVILAICFGLGVSGSLLLGSRANMVILLFCILTVLLSALSSLNEKQFLLKRLLLLVIFLVIVFTLNLGGIQDRILNSTLFYRLSVMDTTNSSSLFSADGRVQIVTSYLSQLLSHPLGGLGIETGHSAHNTILQYGAFGGVFSLLLALWFYIPLFVSLMKNAWRDSSKEKVLLLPIIVAIMALFMVESISLSNSIIYSLFIMILIMIDQHYLKEIYDYENKTDVS